MSAPPKIIQRMLDNDMQAGDRTILANCFKIASFYHHLANDNRDLDLETETAVRKALARCAAVFRSSHEAGELD